jgi:hypothetical protein
LEGLEGFGVRKATVHFLFPCFSISA